MYCVGNISKEELRWKSVDWTYSDLFLRSTYRIDFAVLFTRTKVDSGMNHKSHLYSYLKSTIKLIWIIPFDSELHLLQV